MRLLIILTALFPIVCFADGVMFRRTEVGSVSTKVDSPAQEAVLIVHDAAVSVVLRTHFNRGPTEVAWLVPVPAEPKHIESDADDIFTRLDALTAPRFYAVEVAGKKAMGCGCSAASKDEAAGFGQVTVKSTGSAGIFNYSVLTAGSADDLLKWLRDNQFAIPADARDAIGRYVDLKWHWLAIKIRPEMTNSPTLAPHPIRYSYASKDVVFPLVISKPSAAEKNQITLYVLALDQFTPADWPIARIKHSDIHREGGANSGTNYETLFDTATRDGAFMPEYARKIGIESLPAGLLDPAKTQSAYLTRLRTIIPPAAMTRDITLRRAHELPDVDNRFEFHGPARVAAVITENLALIAIPAGLLMLLRSRRWSSAPSPGKHEQRPCHRS